jgi:hypothetical protein
VYFIVPYLVVRISMGICIPIKTYLWMMYKSMVAAGSLVVGSSPSMRWIQFASYAFTLVFYFQNVFTSFEVASTLGKVCRSLTTRAQRVARFFETAATLDAALWSDAAVAPWFGHVSDVAEAPLTCRTTGGCLWARNFGGELRALSRFDHAKATAALRHAYVLDALLAIPRAVEKTGGTWATYISSPSAPSLDMVGLRHPSIPDDRVVKNTWRLGKGGSRNALLTGPNAGGKSTLLKGALTAALMAQTLTFTPCATACRITPFRFLSCHINVPDAQGRESLFEAEMRRAKRNIDEIRALAPDEHALVVMDEIFSSTNPVEGIAGAYAVAKGMGDHDNVLSIISTHYTYLARLGSSAKGRRFRNFRMPVTLDDTGAVTSHPYTLERGVSRQYVALELLRASGFGDDVITEAIAVKRALLGQQPSTSTKDDGDI